MVCAVISHNLICHLLEPILIFFLFVAYLHLSMPLVTWYMFLREKNKNKLEGFCIFKKEFKWHGNITYPYLATRVVAKNFCQQDLSWQTGSVRGNICVLNF